MTDTTWNSADKSSGITLSNGDLTATSDGSSFGNLGVRATNPVAASSGRKVFMSFEALLLQNGDDHIGITNENWSLGDSSGAGAVVFQYGGSSVFQGGFGTPSGFSPSGKILDVALDTVARKIWFREDGGDWNNNPSADPATGVGADAWTDPAAASPAYANYFIAARLRTNGDYATINTTGPFTYSVPAGFEPWDYSGVPELDLVAAFTDETTLTADLTLGAGPLELAASFVDETVLTADPTISGGPLMLAANFTDQTIFSAYIGGKPPPPIQCIIIVTGR